jgi:hypothetical protein
MAVRLSALRACRLLPPARFLLLISVRIWVGPRAIVRLQGLGTYIKNSNGLIGNRTFYLPACSIVPQPNTLPRASVYSTLDYMCMYINVQPPFFLKTCFSAGPTLQIEIRNAPAVALRLRFDGFCRFTSVVCGHAHWHVPVGETTSTLNS